MRSLPRLVAILGSTAIGVLAALLLHHPGSLASLAATTSSGSAPATSSPDARTLYGSSIEADDAVSYSGTLTSVIYGGADAQATVARVDHKAPHAWRIWYIAPADAYGRLIVSNESLTYQYEPENNRVYRNDWSASAPGVAEPVDLDQVVKNYDMQLGPATPVAGRDTKLVSLVSKHTGSLVERVWIDDKTRLILRREIYHPDGSIESKTSFDSIKIGTTFPGNLFDLSVPKGMTLVPGADYGRPTSDVSSLQGLSKFRFADPGTLPYGFRLKNGSMSSHDGVDAVQLVYSDGLRTFSLFEYTNASLPRFAHVTPKPIRIGSVDGEYADVAGETIASWTSNGVIYTMVGDLAVKEITRIGAAVP